ncbi:hypothetical protein ACXR2W_05715 [Leucobacter sp. HY1908]
MYRINASPMPVAVRSYLQQNPQLRFASGALDSDIKRQIREHLAAQQHGRCAYCERKIGDLGSSVIEHFHPRDIQTIGPDDPCRPRLGARRNTSIRVDFDPNNLLLSCDGHRARPASDATCDRRKDKAHVCADIDNPKQLATGAYSIVWVESDGKLAAQRTPSNIAATQIVIEQVLNLNDPSLLERRAGLIADLKEQFNRLRAKHAAGGSTASMRRKFASKLRDNIEEKDYPSTRESIAQLIESGITR